MSKPLDMQFDIRALQQMTKMSENSAVTAHFSLVCCICKNKHKYRFFFKA